jgi:competence protein ComEA
MGAARVEKESQNMHIKGLGAALLAAMLVTPVALAGPVDVNTADASTLARELDGVGLSKAQAIIDYRKANGPFKTPEDLAKVKGLGQKTVDRNRSNLRFDASKAGDEAG